MSLMLEKMPHEIKNEELLLLVDGRVQEATAEATAGK